jgi:hypothetical protein
MIYFIFEVKNSKQCTPHRAFLPLEKRWVGGGGGQLTFPELKETCTFFTLSGRINHSEICKAPPTLLQLIAPTQFARLIIIPAAANWKDFTWAPLLYQNLNAHEISLRIEEILEFNIKKIHT